MESDPTQNIIESLKLLESPSDIAKGLVQLSRLMDGKAVVLLRSAKQQDQFDMWFDPLNMQQEYDAKSTGNIRPKLVMDIQTLKLRVCDVRLLEIDESSPFPHRDAVDKFGAAMGYVRNTTKFNYATCLTKPEK